MIIREVDELDKVWAILASVNLNINGVYSTNMDILNRLQKAKDPQERYILTQLLFAGEQALIAVINANLLQDTSTKELKEKAIEMLNDLRNKRAEIGK